jgi:hypothetical protein
MKSIKVFALVALGALMAMAFIGASSAAAESTVLCLEDPGTGEHEACPEGPPASQLVTHVHEATLEGNPALLLSSVVEVKCTALFLGDVTSENGLGNPLEVLGNFTYSNCKTSSGKECTVAEITGTDAKLKLSKSGHELADVTYQLEWNVHCGFLINCTYDGEGLKAHALGPLLASEPNGETRIEEQVMHRVSGFCPETAKLDLLTTPLEAVHIAE